MFAEFSIFESIFIGFLHISLIITFQFYSAIFLPLFLCTDGTLVIFLFTRGFVNTKERQVTSNRSYRHAQFEFATSSLSLCRQFKPLKRIHRTFFLLDTVYLSVSFQSHPERMTLFLQLIYDFSALIVFSLLLFFIPVLQWA